MANEKQGQGLGVMNGKKGAYCDKDSPRAKGNNVIDKQ